MDDSRPIFVQIAEQIEKEILSGALAEGDQVPSTNEYAAFLRINPATVGKGVNLLVDAGILFKKRGIGMFVAEGARATIVSSRRELFHAEYVKPLVLEARNLGISPTELNDMVRKEGNS